MSAGTSRLSLSRSPGGRSAPPSLRRHYPDQVQTVGGPDAALSAPAHGAPVVVPWYSRGCAILSSMATDRDQRLRALEAARLYFVCEGLPAGRRSGSASRRGPARRRGHRPAAGEVPAPRRGADCARRPLPPRGRRAPGAVHPQRPAGPGRGLRGRRRPRRPARTCRWPRRAGWPAPRRWSGSRPIRPSRSRRPARPPARTAPTRSASARCGRRPTKEGRPGTGLELIEYAAARGDDPLVRDRRDRRRKRLLGRRPPARSGSSSSARSATPRIRRPPRVACAKRSRPASGLSR